MLKQKKNAKELFNIAKRETVVERKNRDAILKNEENIERYKEIQE